VRICGRFVRRSEPVCRSIPTVHLATTSLIIRFAIRAASEPRAEPGKDRFRSRRSGRYRLPAMNPSTFTIGTAISVPRRVFGSSPAST
jgi:hypothetical protein